LTCLISNVKLRNFFGKWEGCRWTLGKTSFFLDNLDILRSRRCIDEPGEKPEPVPFMVEKL
jgi:hypothetical protein